MILEIIYTFEVGGSERLAAAIASAAKKAGEDIAVCALNGDSGAVKDQLRNENIPCYGFDSNKVSKFALLFRLYQLFRKIKPDVIHVHHVSQYLLVYWPAKLAFIKKIVLTEHANYSIKVNKKLNKRAKRYCKKADVLTTVNDDLRFYFNSEINVPSDKLVTIPNGVNTRHYTPGPADIKLKAELNPSSKKLVLSCIGRLVEAKDHLNLINAIKIVLEKGINDFVVLIVGDGNLRDSIEACVNKLGVSENVILTGARSDIVEILRVSDIGILSSRREGFPMTLLEAMSTGKPCISTNVGCVRELITSDVGVVVPPEDSVALATAICDLYNRADDLEAMGLEARKIIVEKYDIDDVLAHYLSVLSIENQTLI